MTNFLSQYAFCAAVMFFSAKVIGLKTGQSLAIAVMWPLALIVWGYDAVRDLMKE